MAEHSLPPIFPCITVSQPLGTFYVMSAAAEDVLQYLTVSRRGLTAPERDKVQRALDPARQKDIATYLRRDDATFPTSITVNADSQRVFVLHAQEGLVVLVGRELAEDETTGLPADALRAIETTEGKRFFTRLPSFELPAEIIDGQHRFEGLRKAIADAADDVGLATRLQKFELSIAIMFDLLPEECAKVFVTINATQRKVDSSHIADLFALHTKRSPQRVSHLIAVAANDLEASPFKGGLKMLGKRVNDDQFLSQGSFTKYLMTLLPRASDSGELLSGSSINEDDDARPFTGLYMNNKDAEIGQIVLNYFKAVAEAYPTAWQEQKDAYLIRKTVGFAALIKLLRKLAPVMLKTGRYSFKDFSKVVDAIKQGFPEDRWAKGQFASSDSEAGRIAKAMYGVVENTLMQVLQGEA